MIFQADRRTMSSWKDKHNDNDNDGWNLPPCGLLTLELSGVMARAEFFRDRVNPTWGYGPLAGKVNSTHARTSN